MHALVGKEKKPIGLAVKSVRDDRKRLPTLSGVFWAYSGSIWGQSKDQKVPKDKGQVWKLKKLCEKIRK